MPRAAALPAAERRNHAVQTLLELARDTAPDQISTASIAERMGVSHGALFRHFPSREALWAEAVGWAIGELEQRIEAAVARLAVPLATVRALMATHAGFLQQHPGLVRMLFAELPRPASSPAREQGKAFMQRFRQRLAAAIAAAQAEGNLDPAADPAELAALLVALQQGLMLQALVHDGFAALGDRSRRSVELFLSAGPALGGPTAAPGGSPAETTAPPGGTDRRRPAEPPVDPPGG